MALIRKNIQMSPEVAQWFENRSESMGVSQSALMTIALKEYIDREKAMSLMEDMKHLIRDVRQLQEQKGSSEK